MDGFVVELDIIKHFPAQADPLVNEGKAMSSIVYSSG